MSIPYIDIHTHHPVVSEDHISVPSLFLQDIDFKLSLPNLFTAGIHPWHAEKFNLNEIKNMMTSLTSQAGLIAVGETGLDKKCKTDFISQKLVFELHIDFAARNQLPLIIHCVNSWNEMISYSKHSKVPLILHGYDANPELTKQLLHHGFYFSIGKALLNEKSKIRETIQMIPATSMLFETDDEKIEISEIYKVTAQIFNCPIEELKRQIFDNYNRIFQR